jgi:hypothetical protein
MFGKKRRTLPIDFERVAAAAVEAAFGETDGTGGRDTKQQHSDASHDRRLGTATSVASGVIIAIAARAAFKRARNLDLERVAEAAEKRLQGPSS